MTAKDSKPKQTIRKQIFFSKMNTVAFLAAFLLVFSFSAILSIADESDYKSDTINAFSIVEKKAVFNKYEGKLSQKGPDSATEQFPGQKIYIRPAGEWWSEIIYDGSPIKGKYLPVNGLAFSPDHQVALTYGSFRKSGINLISAKGQIYKEVDLSGSYIEQVEPIQDGFIVLTQKSAPVNSPGWKLRVYRFDYSGNEIWHKDFDDGIISWHATHLLSASPNGHFLIFASQKKNGKPKEGITYILNGDGKVLNKFNIEYQSIICSDNETTLLVSQKHLRLLDLKSNITRFNRDLEDTSKDMFGMPENNQLGKGVATYGVGNRLEGIFIFDPTKNKVINFDAGSTDWGTSKIYFSESENKLIIKTFDQKHYGECKAIDINE